MDKKMEKREIIDVHCHILPGLDDGAENMEQTMNMFETAYEQGVTAVIATPHFLVGKNNRTVWQKTEEAYAKTVREVERRFRGMRIYLGNEIFYLPGSLSAVKKEMANTLAGGRYVLTEYNNNISFEQILSSVEELIMEGYIPLIAHVERFTNLWKNNERIKHLIKAGAYIQMNAESLLGNVLNRDAAYCRSLVKEGLIHVIGSDAHDTKNRGCRMLEAFHVIEHKIGFEKANEVFFENANKIIKNQYI